MAVMIRHQGSTQGCPIDCIATWDDLQTETPLEKEQSQGFQNNGKFKFVSEIAYENVISRFRLVRMRCFVSLLRG